MRERFERTHEAVRREGDNLVKVLNASGTDVWEVVYMEDCTWNFHVKNQHGHELYVDLRDADSNSNRKYVVRVSWPGGRSHRVNCPQDDKSFGCGYDRGAEGLSQTIVKRVMPYLLEHWQERLDVISKVESDEDSQLATIQKLEKRFGRKPTEGICGKSTIYGSGATGIHTVQVNHDGSRATVDLSRASLPMETVFKLIDWMEKADKK